MTDLPRLAQRHSVGGENQLPVVVGKIGAPSGLKGWFNVYSHTRPAAKILEYDRWLLANRPDADEWMAVAVASVRQQSEKLRAKLAGVDDRNGADGLVGKWIAVDPSQLAQLPKGEYYWSDLTGLSVVDQDGVELGIVDHLVETGANDVLVVRHPGVENDSTDGADEHLLPWSPDVIIEVDLEGGRIRVNWHPHE